MTVLYIIPILRYRNELANSLLRNSQIKLPDFTRPGGRKLGYSDHVSSDVGFVVDSDWHPTFGHSPGNLLPKRYWPLDAMIGSTLQQVQLSAHKLLLTWTFLWIGSHSYIGISSHHSWRWGHFNSSLVELIILGHRIQAPVPTIIAEKQGSSAEEALCLYDINRAWRGRGFS